MKRLWIHGGQALTMNPKRDVIDHPVIEIVDGKIRSIRSQLGFQAPQEDQSIDANNCLVLPGFVNGHTHLGMGLLRGIAEDLPLERWLSERIFPLERRWNSREFHYLGARVSLFEMVRCGTTLFNDMNYFEEEIVRAADEIGIRGLCGQTVIEKDGVCSIDPVQQTLEAFIEGICAYPRLRPSVAPHSVYGTSEPTIRAVMEIAKKHQVPIHVHLSETAQEVKDCKNATDLSPVYYCDSLGVFEHRVIAAHGAVLTSDEIKLLGSYQVGVVHNPDSNMKLGTQICPVPELRESGALLCFGTDSVASNNNLDLLQEIDIGAKLQSHRLEPGAFVAKNVVAMLTCEGAKALGWGDEVGSLEVGKAADIVAVCLDQPHAVPFYDPYVHLVHSARGTDVKHSIIDGRVVMKDFSVQTVSQEALFDEARQFSKKIQAGLTDP